MSDDFITMAISSAILDYCTRLSTPADPVLNALERAANLRTLSPQMISGPYQGMLLQFISHMIRPENALEIGAFTGYSAICLAQGLAPGGILHTIEVNDELQPIIREFLAKAALEDKVRLHIGDAAQILPNLDETFDLAFLDAGKLNYAEHYELVVPKMRPGGFILADNVLWDGKVVHDPKDATAEALRQFNEMVHADPRVQNLILPLRDGLLLARIL